MLSVLTAPAALAIAPAAEKLIVVDCLLPAPVRQLGGMITYLPPRVPVKTTASECEIRGGEYVAYDRANYATALQVWLGKAKEGDAQAETYVGEIYEKGMGLSPNFAEAAQWYSKAASGGYPRALSNLAYLYEQGRGVPKDPVKALNLYRRSAGLTDDDLTFASEVTSVRSQMQTQIDQLSAQLEEQNAATAALRSELESSHAQLAARKSKLAIAERDARSLRARVQQLEAAGAGDSAQVAAELQRAKGDLAASEQRIEAQQVELTNLESLSAQQQSQLSARLEEAQHQEEALRKQLGDQTLSAEEARTQLAAAQARQRSMSEQLNSLGTELSSLKAAIAVDRGRLQQQASAPSVTPAQTEEMRRALAAQEAHAVEQENLIAQLRGREKEYATEVTRLQAQAAATQQAGQTQDNELQSSRAQLAAMQQRLQQSEQRLAEANEAAAADRDRIAQQSRLLENGAMASAAQQQQIQKWNQELATREAQLVEQNNTIAALEGEKRSYLEQINKLKSEPSQTVVRSPVPPLQTSVATELRAPVQLPREVEIGEYHALIIGINKYEFLPTLQSAVNDAEAVEQLLRTKYGFKTQLLRNATRADVLMALNDYRTHLSTHDNLLIYYAGHGELDQANLRGYWLPVNAHRDDTTEWISDQMVTDQIGLMAARHILVVADSCYSGAMTRGTGFRLVGTTGDEGAEMKRLSRLLRLPSRTVLTSGGEEPVIDNGGQGNSIFARAFLGFLSRNDHIVEAQSVYNAIFDVVRQEAARLKVEQSPRYAGLADAGHLNGEFLFVPTS
jgi:Caspase domain/Sel1 repeat